MISIEHVTKEVSAFYNVSIKQLKSKSRKREIVFPRQMAMAICKTIHHNETLKAIGNYFGGRHHSTVIHACMAISDLCSYDKQVKTEYETLVAQIMSKLVEPKHISDGLYLIDNGYGVQIAVNHHKNVVAYLDTSDIDRYIKYLEEVKMRLNTLTRPVESDNLKK